MITIRPIKYADAPALDSTEYGSMSAEERHRMISESLEKTHNGRYFELFTVCVESTIVGFMNAYAHSEHIISIGPEIMSKFKRLGYAYEAESMVLELMKEKGYLVATGAVKQDNVASHALHRKLGFEVDVVYTNKQGKQITLYIKAL